jgi:hypothetical protein
VYFVLFLCYSIGMRTNIYAVYLPGSERPDYVGSHLAESPTNSRHMGFMYKHHTYVGAGAWVSRTGSLKIPNSCAVRPWGALLLAMAPHDRLALRVETLEVVNVSERWKAEARAIRQYAPPFNVALKEGPQVRRERWNAYHRGYRKGYYERNPDKAAAKRESDKLRARAKRAAAKGLVA